MKVAELEIGHGSALKSLAEVDEKFNSFIKKVGGLGGLIGGGLGGIAAFEGIHQIMEGFEHVLALTAHMQDLHNATGASVHDLVILSHALDLTGVGADKAQDFIFKLQQSIGGVNEEGKSTEHALKALGLSQKGLRDKGAIEQLEQVQKGLAGISNQADKAQIIGDLFGKKMGSNAMRFFANPEGLEQAKKQAEPLAAVMQTNAEAFHALDDAIKGVGMNMDQFFAGALEKVAGNATSVAGALSSIDFVEIGRGVGEVLNVFVTLSKVLLPLISVINSVGSALDHVHLMGAAAGAAAGAGIGALFGGVGAVPGAVIGGGLGLLGTTLGMGKHEKSGIADAFKGMHSAGENDQKSISALQLVGGGGGFGSGSNHDPILEENQRHTKLLETIASNTSKTGGSAASQSEQPPV